MRPRLTTCYKCDVKVKPAKTKKEGVMLKCMRCPQCKEEYFTSSELLRFDVLTGRTKLVRKFGTLGDSTIIRIPPEIIKEYKIKPGDISHFEKRPNGILIKLIHAKDLKT
jgi:hypothetical protein